MIIKRKFILFLLIISHLLIAKYTFSQCLTTTTDSTDASCWGACDGTATANPSVGTPPYNYLWDVSAGSQTTQTATNLCASTYSVKIIDSGGGTVVFWSENFETDPGGCSSQGSLASAYSGPNGPWTVTSTGGNGVTANIWYVSATEAGMGVGNCGGGCIGSPALTDRTLHVGNDPGSTAAFLCPTGDCGANYDASSSANEITNKRAESPAIDCSGQSNITLSFNYMENGDGSTDNATLWYYDSSTPWMQLFDLNKTALCGSQGRWTAYSIALPATANNDPNVKIGFNWTNDGDGSGTDPSFAVDDIELDVIGGGYSDTEKSASRRINIYPNPNNGVFNIKFETSNNENILIKILNISNQVVLSGSSAVVETKAEKSQEQVFKIDMRSFAKGIYFISLITGDKIYSKKLIIY